MSRPYLLLLTLTLLLLCAGCEWAAVPESGEQPADLPLPIIDLHFHPDTAWEPAALAALMEQLGVRAAGNGGEDADVLAFAERAPGRFIPFAAQYELARLIASRGAAAWTLRDPQVRSYLEQLESWLVAGWIRGLGELFPHRAGPGGLIQRYPADAPLMQALWSLSARYGVPLSVHMDATPDSVEEMKRLLDSDPGGVWIWAHCGSYAEPPLLAALLAAHANLLCELSYRESIRPRSYFTTIDVEGDLRPEWLALIESFPLRFLLGTDVDEPSPDAYATSIAYWRGILAQLSPATAAAVSHGNAERVLR